MKNEDTKSFVDTITQGTKEIVESSGKEYKPSSLESIVSHGTNKELSNTLCKQINEGTEDAIKKEEAYRRVYGGKTTPYYPG